MGKIQPTLWFGDLYLSDEFSFTIKDIEIDSDLWDGQYVEVNGGNLDGKVTLGNIYRPPRFNNSNLILKTFLTFLNVSRPNNIPYHKR